MGTENLNVAEGPQALRGPSRPLWSGFHRSALAFPERPALEVGGQAFSYRQLHDQAAALAATLRKQSHCDAPPLTGVFAHRSFTAYSAVLGALFRGHGYVPLNRMFPPERTRFMLERSGCRSLIVDRQSEPQLAQILAEAKAPMLLLFPEQQEVRALVERWPQHRVLGALDLEPPQAWVAPESVGQNLAYLLFTSGSTGVPKGVMISHDNVRHYLDWAVPYFDITEEDRVSQTFDLTFDLSVHDMFVAWEQGACVCCPSQKQLLKPSAFIQDSRLSIWFSVPSLAVFMRRLGLLKSGAYPNLRLSLFCGEGLPMETVREWARAAPNAVIENIYGPTELTIACTAYRWNPERSPNECIGGLVPIGEPLPGMEALIADEQLREVNSGAEGELLMTGPQLGLGYWQDQEKTARAFVAVPGRGSIYYRTGDRVLRPGPGKPISYVGRMDHQIKILGHRVELPEIEAVVRQLSGLETVVAVGWPITASGADGVEIFLQADRLDVQDLQNALTARLPAYMVPRRIHLWPQLPLNANGKIDRNALLQHLHT